MKRIFAYTEEFDREWERLGLTENERLALEIYLLGRPTAGKVIQGTGGLRKLRWVLPNSNKGKRSGLRVIYIDFAIHEKLYLMRLYSKNEKDDLTEEEKDTLKKLIKIILKSL